MHVRTVPEQQVLLLKILWPEAQEERDGSPGEAVMQLARPLHRTTTRVAFNEHTHMTH